MNLLKIWKNKTQILEGLKNLVLKDQFVEEVAEERNKVCNDCTSKGDKCEVKGTAPCCNECGCSLKLKTRSLSSSCPLGKWDAVLTEEEDNY